MTVKEWKHALEAGTAAERARLYDWAPSLFTAPAARARARKVIEEVVPIDMALFEAFGKDVFRRNVEKARAAWEALS